MGENVPLDIIRKQKTRGRARVREEQFRHPAILVHKGARMIYGRQAKPDHRDTLVVQLPHLLRVKQHMGVEAGTADDDGFFNSGAGKEIRKVDAFAAEDAAL